MSRVLSLFSRVKFPLAAFLIPLGIRAVPEILSGQFPVGWDIIAYYIPNTLDLANGNMSFWNIVETPPLMYALAVPIYVMLKINIILLFKILGPLLYGFLGSTVFRFCKNQLEWSQTKAFYAVLFVSAYFVTLRLGWDAYQAELGLSLLLLSASLVGNTNSIRSILPKILLLTGAVLANQIVGVLVVATILTGLLRTSTISRPLQVLVQAVPIAIFGLVAYATLHSPIGPGFAILGSGTSAASFLASSAFLGYSYIFVVPLAVFGLALLRRSFFGAWLVACALGLALSLLPGFVFQDIGYRWALLLALPLLLAAYEGVTRLQGRSMLAIGSWRVLKIAMVSALAISAALFAVLPAQSAFPLYTAFPQFLPSSMVQSSLPSSDYSSIVSAMAWINAHSTSESAIIVHQAFYGWARMYVASGREVVNSYLFSPTSAMPEVVSYQHVFTVWWAQGKGWFQESFPIGATPVASFGDLVVYQYR